MICTFYSFKGGVGRSMALANVASMLAQSGHRVLVVDFDLEAPGIEQFFGGVDLREIRRHDGLLDLLLSYKRSMSTAEVIPREAQRFRRLEESFIVRLYHDPASGGRLDLLPAGRRGDDDEMALYAFNLRNFDWQDFYYNWAGESFFEWLRRSLTPDLYDVVLVDSRTGVTEMGGICAYQLADVIVMLCAPNQQNIDGTKSVAENFFSSRVRALRGERPLDVVIVPARVDLRDENLVRSFREKFNASFEGYEPPPLVEAGVSFWDLLVPYQPEYAFAERLVTDLLGRGDERPLVAAFQQLVEALRLLAGPSSPLVDIRRRNGERGDVSSSERRFDSTRRWAEHDVLVSYDSRDEVVVRDLIRRLGPDPDAVDIPAQSSLDFVLGRRDLAVGAGRSRTLDRALFQSRCLMICVGADGLNPWDEAELRTGWEHRDEREHPIVVVVLPGARTPPSVSSWLDRIPTADLRTGLGLDDREAILHLRALFQRLPSLASRPSIDDAAAFHGLAPFEERDSDRFFGREVLVDEAIELLHSSRFLAVAGPPGCGKTSLVQAGIIPALRGGRLPGSETWLLAKVRPGQHPLDSLAMMLARLGDGEHPPLIEQGLADDVADLSRRAVRILDGGQRSVYVQRRLVIFVDQCEELFTLRPRESERTAFIRGLMHAVGESEGRVMVIIAVRVDALADCAEYPDLLPLVERRLLLVPPLGPEELRDVVERPALLVGLAFEPGLVDRIIADVDDQRDILALLQFLLLQLESKQRSGWLTHSAYDEMRGVRGAMALRADAVYDALTPDEQAVAASLLKRLVHVDDGAGETRRRVPLDARRQVRLDELLSGPKRAVEMRRTIDTFIEAGLLVSITDESRTTTYVSLAHEALVQGWPRLRRWVDEDRQFLRWREYLRSEVTRWEAGGCSSDALLGGASLDDASRWMRTRGADLSPAEARFVQTSVHRSRRRRNVEITAWTLVVGLVVMVVVGVVWSWQADSVRRVATSETLAAVSTVLLDTRLDLALLLGVEANRLAAAREVRIAPLAGRFTNPHLVGYLHGNTMGVFAVALSPRGEGVLSGGDDRAIRRWDASTGRLSTIYPTGQRGTVYSMAFSPDQTILASSLGDGRVRLFDAETGQLSQLLEDVRRPGPEVAATSVGFSADGQTIASGDANGIVRVWNIATGQVRAELTDVVPVTARSIGLSRDGSLVAAGDDEGTVRVWDVASGTRLFERTGAHKGSTSSVAFGADGRTLVSGGADHAIRTWNTTSGVLEGEIALSGHLQTVTSLVFSLAGGVLASGSADGSIRVWDLAQGQSPQYVLSGHTAAVTSLAFSSDGKRLVSGSADKSVLLWDLEVTGSGTAELRRAGKAVTSVAFSRDGQTLAATNDDGSIALWDLTPSPAVRRVWTGSSNGMLSAAFGPDGSSLVSGGRDGVVRVWDISQEPPNGRSVGVYENSVKSVTVSPDGRWLASASRAGSISVWDAVASSPPRSIKSPAGDQPFSVAFSPDGETIAAGYRSGTVRLWTRRTGEQISSDLTAHTGAVNSVAFSKDGRIVASGSGDTTIILWDVASHTRLGSRLEGHLESVESVAFSPDGLTLASGSQDRTVILWDISTRRVLGRPLSEHRQAVTSVAFSPDGRVLASGSDDKTIRLWDLNLEAALVSACRRANRNLTEVEWTKYLGEREPYRKTCPNLSDPR